MIPGWGFYGPVLLRGALQNSHCISLAYANLKQRTIQSISIHLAKKIADQSILCAWSLGGLIAIKMASHFPHKIKHLILVGTTPRFLSARGWHGIQHHLAASFLNTAAMHFSKTQKQLLKLCLHPCKDHTSLQILKANLIHGHSNKLFHLLIELFASDLREEYASMPCHLLHILCLKDAILAQDVDDLKKIRPCFEPLLLHDAGHFPFISHQQIIQRKINEFLD